MQRDLVERAKTGDLDAFAQLVKASAPRLRGVANIVLRSDVGIRATIGTEQRVASNRVEGGNVGIQVGGAGLVEGNEVSGARNVGVVISGDESLTLTGNTSCDNGLDLRVGSNASPLIDDSNTFCELG